MTSRGVPLGSGDAPELPHREIDALLLRRLHIGKLRQALVADDREQADAAGVELRADFLQLANPHVEGVVQHVDQHVAASLERRHHRRHLRPLLDPLHRLALERRRVRRAPSPLAGARVVEHLLQRLELGVRRSVEHLGVVEDIHDRLEVAVAGRGPAHERRVDKGRRGGVEHAAIGLGLREHGHRLRAAAAGEVVHDNPYAHDAREVRRHLAQEDIAAAARARVRGQHDHALRIFGLRVRKGDECYRHNEHDRKLAHREEYSPPPLEISEGTEATGSHGATEQRRRRKRDCTSLKTRAVYTPVMPASGRHMDRPMPCSQAVMGVSNGLWAGH